MKRSPASRTRGSDPSRAATPLHRQCVCGTHAGASCRSCDQSGQLQRTRADRERTPEVPENVGTVLRNPGHRLDQATRAFFEPRLGHDLNSIRLHTDTAAAASADAVGARAYTVGREIVFAPHAFAPASPEGRRLLAHELAHAVGNAAGAPDTTNLTIVPSNDPSERHADAVARQVTEHDGSRPSGGATNDAARSPDARASTLARQAAPAGPPPVGWSGCAAAGTTQLAAELAAAASWVAAALADLQSPDRPAHTTGALGRYLTTNAPDVTGTIRPRLTAILAQLNRGPTNFRCQTEAQCRAAFPTGANAYSGHPITLCPGYFRKDDLGRPTTLIHEAGHNAGLGGNVVEWQWPFPDLNRTQRLANTESYAAFVRSNRFPGLPPLQEPEGAEFGLGTAVPSGGGTPRFLVTAEYDHVQQQRLVRFLDLRLNARVDFDSSGTVLFSGGVGTRIFAPTSLSRVPVFVDLRAGAVLGRVGGLRAPVDSGLVVGPFTDTRLGLRQGHFGGSIGYRHIFNLVRGNPDLHELVIYGEVRFP